MKKSLQAVLVGIAVIAGATGVANAMSEFTQLELTSVQPAPSQAGNTTVYSFTATRQGQGLLQIELSMEGLPAGATATFSPAVLRFTGRTPETLTSVVTITCSPATQTGMYDLKVRGVTRREYNALAFSAFLTQGTEIQLPPAPRLSISVLPQGTIQLQGAGMSGATYQIEATSDAANPSWSHVGSCTADANGNFTYQETPTQETPVRFFRAVQTTSTAAPQAP